MQHARPAPRRILIHAINYAPEFIGCAKYTTELAEYLAREGHAVEVVAAPPHYPGWFVRAPHAAWRYARETINGVGVTRCPILMRRGGAGIWRLLAPLSFAMAALPALAWRMLRFRPDVVVSVEPTLFSSPAALLLGRIAGARCVLHVQDLEVDAAFEVGYLRGSFLRAMAARAERVLLGAHDQVVTVSAKMRQALLRKGLPASRVALARNWVDLSRLGELPRAAAAAYRQELAIAQETRVALYAGHAGPKQALDLVIAAARELSARADIVFVIAAEGPSLEGLRRQAEGLANVRFLPLQPVERLNELLALADVHLLPQLAGAADLVMPSKLGGMLASGRPVIAMANAGTEIAQLLEGCAHVLPAGDAEGLVAAVDAVFAAETPERHAARLALAAELDERRVLPQFAALLLGARAQERAVTPGQAGAGIREAELS